MSSDISVSLTMYYRKRYSFGFHATATLALMLLRISSHFFSASTNSNEYLLCPFVEEEVLLLCIDTTLVRVLDVSDDSFELMMSHCEVPMCLVVDDWESQPVACFAWSKVLLHRHFMFTRMSYQRALDWVQQWDLTELMDRDGCMEFVNISLDLHNTYDDSSKTDTFGCRFTLLSQCLVELSLPSRVSASRISDRFLCDCRRLTYLDISPLANVTVIGRYFLRSCSVLTSLDLTPLADINQVRDGFLSRCSALTSLDLSPLTAVTKIGDYCLAICQALTSLDLSPLANVTHMGGGFLCCSALMSLDLSPLANLVDIGRHFLSGCSALRS
eukprot:PhM_4_TR9662/c0_g2_i1/m.41659